MSNRQQRENLQKAKNLLALSGGRLSDNFFQFVYQTVHKPEIHEAIFSRTHEEQGEIFISLIAVAFGKTVATELYEKISLATFLSICFSLIENGASSNDLKKFLGVLDEFYQKNSLSSVYSRFDYSALENLIALRESRKLHSMPPVQAQRASSSRRVML